MRGEGGGVPWRGGLGRGKRELRRAEACLGPMEALCRPFEGGRRIQGRVPRGRFSSCTRLQPKSVRIQAWAHLYGTTLPRQPSEGGAGFPPAGLHRLGNGARDCSSPARARPSGPSERARASQSLISNRQARAGPTLRVALIAGPGRGLRPRADPRAWSCRRSGRADLRRFCAGCGA